LVCFWILKRGDISFKHSLKIKVSIISSSITAIGTGFEDFVIFCINIHI